MAPPTKLLEGPWPPWPPLSRPPWCSLLLYVGVNFAVYSMSLQIVLIVINVNEASLFEALLLNEMQGAKQRADAAAGRAADYLATKIVYVTDPFQMAILTYALQVSHHKHSDSAYKRLHSMSSEHRTSAYICTVKTVGCRAHSVAAKTFLMVI